MAKKLQGRVAVVTGASKGIGAGIAKRLASEGASVIVNYASSRAGAEKVVADIVAAGGRAVAVQADVSKEVDVLRLLAETKRAYGKLDILVNNAGIYEFGAHRGGHPGAVPQAIRPERTRPPTGLAGGGQVLRRLRRFDCEHQLGRLDGGGAVRLGLRGDEGGRGRDHEVAGEGTRAEKDSRELDQPRHGRDGGHARRGHH